MISNDWIPIANLALNLLLIPLLLILNGIKNEISKMTAILDAHATRIDRIERRQDK